MDESEIKAYLDYLRGEMYRLKKYRTIDEDVGGSSAQTEMNKASEILKDIYDAIHRNRCIRGFMTPILVRELHKDITNQIFELFKRHRMSTEDVIEYGSIICGALIEAFHKIEIKITKQTEK